MAHRRAPEADLDLDDIWCYVFKNSRSIETADRLVDFHYGPLLSS